MRTVKSATKDIRTLPTTGVMLPGYEAYEQLDKLSKGEDLGYFYKDLPIWQNALSGMTGGTSPIIGAMLQSTFGFGGDLVPRYNWSPEALDKAAEYSFLDEKEREALRADPGLQQTKAGAQVLGKYASGALLPGSDAALADKGFRKRVLGKGIRQAPGNILQAYGMAEPYKGDSETGSMLAAGGLSFLLPFLEEGAKEVGKKLGVRASARAQAIPGKTTEERAANMKLAKEEGVSGITAQGRIDKAVPKVQKLATDKQTALSVLPEEQLPVVKEQMKEGFEEMVNKQFRSSRLKGSQEYLDVIEAIDNAPDFNSLDIAATKIDDLINYESDKLSELGQDVYKAGREAIINTLKQQSGQYETAKNSLNNIYTTTLGKGTLKQAEREVQGLTLPLIAGGAEIMALPKGAFSAAGSAAGGALQLPGKAIALGQSIVPETTRAFATSVARQQ
jgi:hypothetical protein